MDSKKVENWLEENKEVIGLEEFSIQDIKQGESNHNFIIQTETEKLVLRISREVSRRNRLENEHHSLNLLEKHGMASVPRSRFFSRDTEFGAVIIETFVGEKDLERAGEMNEEQVRNLAELMAETHRIDIESYNDRFDEDEDKARNLKDIYRDELEIWSRKPYEEYLEIADEPVEELEDYFEKQKQLVEEVPEVEVTQAFIHSDLGFNLRTSEDEVFIVDWEYGTAGYPGHDIMILFEHGNMSEEQRETFLKEYRKHRELGDEFEKVREIHPGFLAFHDAVWAAKRVEREPERDDRQKLFERKMDKLETFYKNRN